MRDYVWLTAPSGTEGTTTVYVDSVFGDDRQGTGYRTAPYKTLTKAWKAKETKPTTIVCRGLFSEQMTEGTHATNIYGDYYGAAIFDGQGKYLIYGYNISKLIVINAMSDSDVNVSSNNVRFRGVGRAFGASSVGAAVGAAYVFGVGAPSAFVGNSGLYWGIIGGNTAVKDVVYWKPYCSEETYLLTLGTLAQPCLNYCTVYDAGFDEEGNPTKMRKFPNASTTANGVVQSTIMSKVVIILNDQLQKNFSSCLFAADCKYYYFEGENSKSGYTEISLDGVNREERGQYLIDRLTQLYADKSVAASKQYFPAFTNCIFSDQTAEELFNNPSLGDMTLIPNCDADTENGYLGALPPAKNIPILSDSTGKKETWDERSASGCVVVSDDKIYIDTNSESDRGSIMSKILTINPRTTQFNGIYAITSGKWNNGYILGSNDKYTATGENAIYEPTPYAEGASLPAGLYMVTEGEVIVDDYTYYRGEAFKVASSYTLVGGSAISVLEPNAGEVLYCRCRSAIYQYAEGGTVLTRGATYLNVSGENITYHGRSIADGESFVCMADGEVADAKIAVVFDDDTVPPSEWVPARFWGEYYVGKENGAIKYDAYGIPYGSGNIRTWNQKNLYKSVLDRKYVQFKIEVTKI